MPSFQISIEPNRRAAARFVGQVRRALQKAFVEEQQKRGISQSDIARALGVHRSVINRELKGFKDLTLGRVAEIAWVLGRKPVFNVSDTQVQANANYQVTPIKPRIQPTYSKAASPIEPPFYNPLQNAPQAVAR